MRVVELDAKNWRSVLDFSCALKAAFGSCEGHGASPDAWIDSMIYGGMNVVEAPYVVRVTGTANCSNELRDKIALLADVIREARAWKRKHYGADGDVSFQIDD